MLVTVEVLIAGVGNVLRGDDGFGVAVAQQLAESPIPSGVRVLDVGIGGIHMVQALLDRVDALVVIDAVDLGRPPGTISVVRPEVRDITTMTAQERRDQLADMHYATPERALMLARGLQVLPDRSWVVGCQPVDTDRWGEGLSTEVGLSVDAAAGEVRKIVTELGIPWR